MKTRDLFSILPLVLFLIIVGCGGSGGGGSGGGSTAQFVSISIIPANPQVPVGVAKQFAAVGTYSDGTSPDITNQAAWSSSNPSVATVNSSGLATAVEPGITTFTATSGSVSGSTTLAVSSATLSSIAVTPANPRLPVGVAQQLAATGTYSDGTSHDITTQATWSSSNTAVAAVNASGLGTAVAIGTATITATQGSVSGGGAFMVTPAILSSIAVTPANPRLPVGVAQQLAATGTYSDGTSHDITTQVTWSSSNTSLATVYSSGLGTAVAAGTTAITAAKGSISGNTTLTVTLGGMISLAWGPPTTDTDGNPLTNLRGFRIYYGTVSKTYDHFIDVGNVTTYTLIGLTQGSTYYITATAYNTFYKESYFSNEVSGMAK